MAECTHPAPNGPAHPCCRARLSPPRLSKLTRIPAAQQAILPSTGATGELPTKVNRIGAHQLRGTAPRASFSSSLVQHESRRAANGRVVQLQTLPRVLMIPTLHQDRAVTLIEGLARLPRRDAPAARSVPAARKPPKHISLRDLGRCPGQSSQLMDELH